MSGKNWFEWINQGWYASYPLILCSLIVWAVIFERALRYRKLKQSLHSFHLEATNLLLRGELDQVKSHCQENLHLPSARLILFAFDRIQAKDERVRNHWKDALERKRQETNHELKQYLWILGTIATTAPFIGLYGTVVGILRSFFNIAEAGKGGFAVVSAGIAEALLATAGGIVVAVIASLAFNAFQTFWVSLVLTVRTQLEEVVELMEPREL